MPNAVVGPLKAWGIEPRVPCTACCGCWWGSWVLHRSKWWGSGPSCPHLPLLCSKMEWSRKEVTWWGCAEGMMTSFVTVPPQSQLESAPDMLSGQLCCWLSSFQTYATISPPRLCHVGHSGVETVIGKDGGYQCSFLGVFWGMPLLMVASKRIWRLTWWEEQQQFGVLLCSNFCTWSTSGCCQLFARGSQRLAVMDPWMVFSSQPVHVS